jgi:aminotransferase
MNPRIAEIPPSIIRSINARKRPGDIDLGLGEPTLPPDIEPFLAAVEWTRSHGSPYSPNAGFPELRAAIARYLGRQGWIDDEPAGERVCVTVGSEEALYLAIKAVVDPGRDEVLIVEPCYLAYPKICLLEGVRHRMVPLAAADGFRPRAEVVLEAMRPETRLVILNTPSNPTGRVWPEDELRALAEGLARRRHERVFVLSDEVYRELYYGEEQPSTIASYHPDSLVAGSLSKSCALTGLRLGWLAGPEDVVAAAVKVHQFVNTAASTFSQRVAIELFSNEARLSAHRPAYAAVRQRLLAAADKFGLEIIPPEGAFYAFVGLPPALRDDSVAAAQNILDERRVVTVPGRAFGASGEGWLRISWVAPPDVVEEAVWRLSEWARESGSFRRPPEGRSS